MKAAVNGVLEPLGARRLVGRGATRRKSAGRSRATTDEADAEQLYRVLEDRSCPASHVARRLDPA